MYNDFNLHFSYYLVISHVNVNSLVNKVSYIKNVISECCVDVLGISETWLNDEIYNSIVDVHGYDIIRSDSPSGRRKHGVCVYVRNNIKYEELNWLVPNVTLLYLPDYGLYIVIVYRPPSNNNIDNIENQVLINFLTEFCNNKEVLIMGDFNLPSLDWSSDSMLSNYISPTDLEFLNTFTALGLEQLIRIPTNFPVMYYNRFMFKFRP